MSKKFFQNNQPLAERHLNVRLLPILAGAFGLVYLLTGYRGWYIFFLGIAGAWLMAWFWTRSLARNLRMERKTLLSWATVGEAVPEQVNLINQGRLPALWVEMTDELDTIDTPLRLVSDIGSRSHRSRNLSHLFKRRGLYTLGPTRIRCGDPFGIYTTTLHDQHTTSVLVTPPILSMADLGIMAGGWSGNERQRRKSIERITSDAGVRHYMPGDSLRRIHWRATAHHDTLIVRQLEAAAFRDWWIYVDLDRSVQAGSDQNTTLELAIILAASLAVRGLQEHRRVGLVLAGPSFVWLEPKSDPTQRWSILRALSTAQAGNHSLTDLMNYQRPTQVATEILITPSTNSAWVAAADQQRMGGSMLAILIDPTDFGGDRDLGEVRVALAQKRIPYNIIPGSLLNKAYSTSDPLSRRRIATGESGKSYMHSGRAAWKRPE